MSMATASGVKVETLLYVNCSLTEPLGFLFAYFISGVIFVCFVVFFACFGFF